jgi:hypothetical protein
MRPSPARLWCLLRIGPRRAGAPALASLAAIAGCGGTAASPPASPGFAAATQEPPSPAGAQAPAPSADPAPPSATAKGGTAPADDAYDKVKGKDPMNLKPRFEKGAAPAFPVATTSEQTCWRTLGVIGSARQDYEAVTAKCGAATGAVEYVKPAIGHLHHKHQRRDVFVVPIQGGLCYRFFGVGDATIKDLDILIEKNGGALVGEDKTTGPVAVIESDKAWCMDRDGVYSFLVQVHGEGRGQYIFGIWARKDTK